MTREADGARTARDHEADQDTSATETPAVAVEDEDLRDRGAGGAPRGRDFFTDAVPLRGDSELRERDERIRRLEQARPPVGLRASRARIGAVAAVVAVLAAGALSILGRSSTRHPDESRSAAPARKARPTLKVPVATPDKIGLGPSVAVATTPPKRGSPRPTHKRSHRRQDESSDAVVDTSDESAAPPVAPETVEPESTTTEPEPETTEPPESEPPAAPADEQEPDPPVTPARSEGSSESDPTTSEADRQFGFGR